VPVLYKNYVLCVLPIAVTGCTEGVNVGQKCGKRKKCRQICGGVKYQIKHYKIKQNKNIEGVVYLKSN
jgi:hypothetical protein